MSARAHERDGRRGGGGTLVVAGGAGGDLVGDAALLGVGGGGVGVVAAPEGRLCLPVVVQLGGAILPLPGQRDVVPLVVRPASSHMLVHAAQATK